MSVVDQRDQVPDRRRADLPARPAQSDKADRPPASEPPGNEPAEANSPDGVGLDMVLAGNFRTMGSGLYIYAPTGAIFRQMSPRACVCYVDGMVKDAGDPVDPLERLLIEEMLRIHHAGARLVVKAAGATTAEASTLLHSAAARMFSEFRKSLLALKTYREPRPVAGPQVTVLGNVGQQNVTSGTQHNTMIQGGDGQAAVENPESRLEGDQPKEVIDGSASRPPRSTASRDRAKEPSQVEGLHARRPRALAASGTGV